LLLLLGAIAEAGEARAAVAARMARANVTSREGERRACDESDIVIGEVESAVLLLWLRAKLQL